jgi:hypothetical protein
MKFNSVIAYAILAASFGYALPTPNVATSDLQERNVATSELDVGTLGDITTSDGLLAKRNVATSNVATSDKRNVATDKRNVATDKRNVATDKRNVATDKRNVATSNVATS